MVDHCDERERRQIAFKGVITAVVVLIMFTFLGRLIFPFFGITVQDLKLQVAFCFSEQAFKFWKPECPEPVLLPRKKLKPEPRKKLPTPPLEFP